MALFFVAFETDHQPLLVDANDAEHAVELAGKVGEGDAPARVVPIAPGIFVAGLFTEPEDDDAEVIIVDPLPHVADYLERIDAALDGDPPPVTDSAATCGSEADASDDEVVACELEHEHDGQHEGTTRGGEVVRWD
jgi:hypothetical protein